MAHGVPKPATATPASLMLTSRMADAAPLVAEVNFMKLFITLAGRSHLRDIQVPVATHRVAARLLANIVRCLAAVATLEISMKKMISHVLQELGQAGMN